jgi:hypothetical protein
MFWHSVKKKLFPSQWVQEDNEPLCNFPESVFKKLRTGESLQAILQLVKTFLERSSKQIFAHSRILHS